MTLTTIGKLPRWILMICTTSIAIGCMVGLFLVLLSTATEIRFRYDWLLYLLPLAGLLIHFIYKSIGKSSEKGNILIIEEIHKPGAGVPSQMGPIIILTTVITHLFGGSAGREGTAVQVGGSISAAFCRVFKLPEQERHILLTAGIAAGFGAVFGTPLTGALFAVEVLTFKRLKINLLLPALLASVVADQTVLLLGISHTHYQIGQLPSFDDMDELYLVAKVILASVGFGFASYGFLLFSRTVKEVTLKMAPQKWMIPLAGGTAIILLTILNGKPDYLGLGVQAQYLGAVTIPSSFVTGGADTWSWLWKTIYTGITLGTGFKGGEVTPLFFIGSTLGNTLSELMNAPAGLFAALGFLAVFSGATNTPFACTIMGAELFGPEYLFYFAIACFVAYLSSGDSGIYMEDEKSSAADNDSRKKYLSRKSSRYIWPIPKRSPKT
ncbi:H+/Cl- antiporter ClcA [Arcticibacter pallidicorallinus]|uniref:H+/Cl-antiporter ClcA n=1 Tax=Arcticibacter pallidicorallinus TaxID=1259464 RepID=A0A2T0U584_9SPHI|nr:chloride channel protein [Arcticibacter pallidicorallinus]PRY53083.1 H+/Cl- antiporter ClcA [Arcticibacter pallidicorallinus]